MIESLQATPGILWKPAAHPRFAASPPGVALAPLMGVKGDWVKAINEAKAKGDIEEFVADPSVKIPAFFDAAEKWPECAKMINDIRDQSACGCCWAFAGAEAASDRMCIATNAKVMIPLSAQDLCFCGVQIFSHGCNGGQINTPWDHIKRIGAVSGGQFNNTGPFGSGMCSDFSLPHCHHHGPKGADPYPDENTPGCPNVARSPKCPNSCDGGSPLTWKEDKYTFKGKVQSASGEAAIQQMIMAGGPVSTAFTVYSDFENYASGIYHHVSGTMAGGHAVKFVGWGEDENGVKYWKVANSWNPFWGEEGHFRIVRGDSDGNGGIENSVVGASADALWGKKSVLDAK